MVVLHVGEGGNGSGVQYWQLLDRMVQQVCLQTKEGDPDQQPLSIDVKKLLKQSVLDSVTT